MYRNGELKVFACSSGRVVTAEVCQELGVDIGKALIDRFADGEVRIEVLEDVRGRDCFIVGALNPPAENFFEMVLLSRALRASSAGRITLVPTYLGYNRQDRKDRPRVPFSAAVIIAFLAEQSAADRVLVFDVHSEATLGVFDHCGVKVDHLYASKVAVEYLKSFVSKSLVVASPDKGGGSRMQAYANRVEALEENLAFFHKGERKNPGEVDEKKITIIGEVADKDVLFIDDMIDSGGTLIADAKAAKKRGAKRIAAFATHALLSKDAVRKLDESCIDEAIVTDTIYHSPDKLLTNRIKVTVLHVAPLVAEAVKRIHAEESVSSLIL